MTAPLELKPCPFCGYIYDGEAFYCVQCDACGATAGNNYNECLAADSWNRRPTETELTKQRDAYLAEAKRQINLKNDALDQIYTLVSYIKVHGVEGIQSGLTPMAKQLSLKELGQVLMSISDLSNEALEQSHSTDLGKAALGLEE